MVSSSQFAQKPVWMNCPLPGHSHACSRTGDQNIRHDSEYWLREAEHSAERVLPWAGEEQPRLLADHWAAPFYRDCRARAALARRICQRSLTKLKYIWSVFYACANSKDGFGKTTSCLSERTEEKAYVSCPGLKQCNAKPCFSFWCEQQQQNP